MKIPSFFGGDTGLTYEQLKRQQSMAEAMRLRGSKGTPKTAMEGLNSAANSIFGALLEKKLGKQEAAEREKATSAFDAIFGGYGASTNSGGYGGNSFSSTYDAKPSYVGEDVPIMNNAELSFDGVSPAGSGGANDENLSFGEYPNPLVKGIVETANAVGVDPLEFATAISYETGGTFDPMKAGPLTQWGQHRGLIQFGEPQADQYGVDFSNPDAALNSQLGADGAIANYLRSSGFKPGMSGLDLYSTINAGAPGRYGASDANNGGAPGSVADKWNSQMGGHRAKAAALLGGEYTPGQGGSGYSQPQYQSTGGINPAMIKLASNPYLSKGQQSVLGMLMQQQMTANKPMTPLQQMQMEQGRLGIEKSQFELKQMRNPQWVIEELGDGRKYYVDPTGDRPSRLVNPEIDVASSDYRTLTAEEIAALEAAGGYQIGPDNKISKVGGGGITVNNDLGGQDKLNDEFGKLDAQKLSTLGQVGLAARGNIARINRLESFLSESPQGFEGVVKSFLGNRGINTEGLDNIQAATAMINALVPEQRPEGSGPMSDADLELFKQSLPRIINQPGGNALIIQTIRGIAEYDALGADIVQQFRAGELSRVEAFNALHTRAHPLDALYDRQAAGNAPSGGSNTAAISPGDTAGGITFEAFSNDPSVQGLASKYGVTIEEMWAQKKGLE